MRCQNCMVGFLMHLQIEDDNIKNERHTCSSEQVEGEPKIFCFLLVSPAPLWPKENSFSLSVHDVL